MPEGDGSGRLDRIEAILQTLAERQLADHEENQAEHKRLLQWQVLTQKRIDRLLDSQEQHKQRMAHLDERIDKLVSAIRDLIDHIPPENLC